MARKVGVESLVMFVRVAAAGIADLEQVQQRCIWPLRIDDQVGGWELRVKAGDVARRIFHFDFQIVRSVDQRT